jgi:hypothetical protein
MNYCINKNIYNQKYDNVLSNIVCKKEVISDMKIRYTILIILMLCIFTVNITAAEPTINNIIIIPENPKPESSVTIIADISGENISEIILSVSECDAGTGACFENHHVTMTLNQQGTYQAEITLRDSRGRTDSLEYQFTITADGEEYIRSEESWKTYLDISPSNENNQGDEDKTNDTPGFELLIVITALFVSLILLKKRDRR